MNNLSINNLPGEYEKIWQTCLPLLQRGRPGDDVHSKETVEFILEYKGKLQFDRDILIPTGMMHDIGHSGILPEHFTYVTGKQKIKNGKLVHMLVGAKIAKDILDEAGYPAEKTAEVVDIISIHDSYQLEGVDRENVYNSDNKKFFHDVDVLGIYSPARQELTPMYSKADFQVMMEKSLKEFFFDEFRELARKRLE